jgi:GTP pyrophosphokinase
VNRASVPGLDALLNRPSAAVLPAPLRQALREHWEAPDCDHQMRATWSVLGDTLDALAMLSADEGAVVAACCSTCRACAPAWTSCRWAATRRR